MTHQHAVKTLAAERYLLEEMPELERHAFEDHYFGCEDCAEEVRLGAVIREGVKAGLTGRRSDTSERSMPDSPSVYKGWRVVLPWAAAASLAIVAGYQSFVMAPAMRNQFGPQALAPVSLRPASRGAAPTVTLGRADVATFAIDLNAVASVTNLTYELSTADGKLVASGRAPAPVAAAPLLLMVPASTFNSPGPYIVVVRNAENGASLGEYRFVVTER